jgi:myo-inositol-1(or 4)-monophosphatase
MQSRWKLAQQLARLAGEELRRGYGQVKQISRKGAVDLLTEYDLRSEGLILDAIRQAFPQDAILSEEAGEVSRGEVIWMVDPLDGTTNFAHGLPMFCVSIACAAGGQLALGVVYDPLREELFQALAGGGAFLNGQRLQVSETEALQDALLVTGFPYDIRTNPENNLDHYSRLALRSLGVRRLGSAALDLAYVAAGRMDGFWELRLNPWDWAAGTLLVREAGGRVTDFRGGQDLLAGTDTIVATNGRVHAELLAALNRPS